MAKSALGRGFGALMGGGKSQSPVSDEKSANTKQAVAGKTSSAPKDVKEAFSGKEYVLRVPVDTVFPSRLQPRKLFEVESLEELTQSIREQGVLQPLVVRKVTSGYELIAGERRWRASKRANLKEVPVVVRQADDRAVLELMLVENLQREDLNPIDEARGFEQLIREFKLTQEAAANRVGKSRVVVANALRLLKLPQSVQMMVAGGKLSVGHAKALMGLELFEDIQTMAERAVSGGLSVRDVESLVARKLAKDKGTALAEKVLPPLNVHLKKVEEKLRERFGTQVKVRSADGEKGSVEVLFFSKDDLNRVLDLLGITGD